MRNRTNPRHGHDHDDQHFARAERGGGWDHDHGHDRGRTHEGRMRGDRGLGGRRGRVFDHGDLRLVMLQLIAERPRHGYEIIKAIEERVGGAYSPSPGVVYPTLTMLEELGHVTVTEQDGKKLHALTDMGRASLEDNRQAVEALQARMAGIAATRAEEPPASVIRATENLKMALRLKLQAGRLNEDQARAIAAALDAAAAAVEQA